MDDCKNKLRKPPCYVKSYSQALECRLGPVSNVKISTCVVCQSVHLSKIHSQLEILTILRQQMHLIQEKSTHNLKFCHGVLHKEGLPYINKSLKK